MTLQHGPLSGSDDDRHASGGHFIDTLVKSAEAPSEPTSPGSNHPLSWEEHWDWEVSLEWDKHWDRSPHNHDQGNC